MLKMSINAKRNGLLNEIYEDLLEMGVEEVKRYKKAFPYELDYNLVQYGNLLIYYYDIREFYKKHGYKSAENATDSQVWEIYKRDVRDIARNYF